MPNIRPVSPNHSINVSSCHHCYGSKPHVITPTHPGYGCSFMSHWSWGGEKKLGGYVADRNSSNSTVWFELLFLAAFTPNLLPGTAKQLQKVQAKVRFWVCVSGSPPTPHLWKLFFGADTGISRVICYFYIFMVSLLKQIRDCLPEARLDTGRFCSETWLCTTLPLLFSPLFQRLPVNRVIFLAFLVPHLLRKERAASHPY